MIRWIDFPPRYSVILSHSFVGLPDILLFVLLKYLAQYSVANLLDRGDLAKSLQHHILWQTTSYKSIQNEERYHGHAPVFGVRQKGHPAGGRNQVHRSFLSKVSDTYSLRTVYPFRPFLLSCKIVNRTYRETVPPCKINAAIDDRTVWPTTPYCVFQNKPLDAPFLLPVATITLPTENTQLVVRKV